MATDRAIKVLTEHAEQKFTPMSDTFQVLLTGCFHALSEQGHTTADIRKMLSRTFLRWREANETQPKT